MTRRGLAAGLGLAAALALALPSPAHAQYFGQNKVQYTRFNFRVLQTPHFDIHYYDETKDAIYDAARIAERSYERLSRILGHEFQERKPIILYASPSDFQQTNTQPGDVGEGTGGFTDFLKHRNVMPFTGAYDDFQHVLTHEMAHQFQFDIWTRGRVGDIGGILAANAPLWFGEGTAEYLSLGPVNTNTAMWLRDAVLEGRLPTIDQLTYDPNIFPYRFGHAVVSFIGERWGDEALGAILKSMNAGGLEPALRRVLGVDQKQLSDLWRESVQKTYLPEVGDRVRASTVATPLLTQERSSGTLHLAPALSPDGSSVAYFSEARFYFVDFYLADGETGRIKRKLLGSTLNPDYETFRFLNSAAAFSPDGRFLAFAAKRGARDDINIYDLKRKRVVKRIEVPLNSVTTPSWSPDGERLVFTGYDGGFSDLFTIRRDGTEFERLTDDKYADLHPVWSPDGRTIAWSTDRGPKTDFKALVFGNYRLALLDLDTRQVRVLDQMDEGRNSNPQWAPDGRSLAFVSDRDGVSNIFLYDLDTNQPYRLTNFFTGVSGFTPLSPVLSWAPKADRLAFMYYEKGKYDVYTIDRPRDLKGEPWAAPAPAVAAGPAAPGVPAADTAAALPAQVREGGSLYRSPLGFRPADQLAADRDSAARAVSPTISVRRLLDSTYITLADTAEFRNRRYRPKFEADYVAQPSIGFVRDNFGRGFYGGAAVQLSDMLGDRQLLFSGYINGRISESQVLATYANISRRFNWAVGFSQQPWFYAEASQNIPGFPTADENTLVSSFRRLVFRDLFAVGAYPVNRFQRFEVGMRFTGLGDAVQQVLEPYDPFTGFPTRDPTFQDVNLPDKYYVQPSAAVVYDNTLFGYTGPFLGRRYRVEFAPVFGDWQYLQATVDLRRYDRIVGPVVLATRAYLFGRSGRDERSFRLYIGYPENIRGFTSGSYYDNECLFQFDPTSPSGCVPLDRLIGTRMAIFNAEIRFPVLNPRMGFLPMGFPPIDGAAFFDAGLAWERGNTVQWSDDSARPSANVRVPNYSVGGSLRMNAFGFAVLRLDYAVPFNRPLVNGLWTLSIGPTF